MGKNSISMGRLTAVLVWLSGILTTGMFYYQLGVQNLFILGFITLTSQSVLTKLQAPIWSWKFPNKAYMVAAIVALIFDTMINMGGLYEYFVNFQRTDVASMLVTNNVPVYGWVPIIVLLVIAIFQSGSPEMLWNMDSRK